MADYFNLKSIVQAISSAPTALGEYLDDGGDFIIYESEQSNPVLIERNNVEDNNVGTGRIFPLVSKPYEFTPRNIPIQGLLTSNMGVRILRMFQGGIVAETVNSVPATKDSLIKQKTSGTTPMLANIVRKNGGEKFLHGDAFVQTVNITQTGKEQPRYSATLQNSGHFADLDDTAIDTADFETRPSYYAYDGVNTKLTFTDGTNNYDFAGDGLLKEVGFQGNQGVIVDGGMGDPHYDEANQCLGSYSQNIKIDTQSGVITAKVNMDANFAIFAQTWLPFKKLTNVKLLFKTCEIIGSTTHHAEIEIQFPIAELTSIVGDQNKNMSAYTLTITAKEGDNTDNSLIKIRVRQVDSID